MESDPTLNKGCKKDSNKVYFLIIVIVALLGTNAYLFFKDRKTDDRVVTMVDEKSRMEVEIDKIEAELDRVDSSNLTLSSELKENQEKARKKILLLRRELNIGKLNRLEIQKAQQEIKRLKSFVCEYSTSIEDLQKKNASLRVERDSLKSKVASVKERASRLVKENIDLSKKVKAAAALKAAYIQITPIRLKRSGKETEVTRAGTTNKLRIAFSILDNPVSARGVHEVYVRIIDPNGNLIISNTNSLFAADGNDLQYTYKVALDFENTNGRQYMFDWVNPKPFQKGTYTVLLYTDGYSMGNSSITLR